MNTKHLKAKILDLAIRGKLVEQKAEDGNAFDLLQKIRDEKMSHGLDFANAKSRKNKQQTETALAKTEDVFAKAEDAFASDLQFEIPENWCWCRFNDLFTHSSGKALKKSDTTGTLRRYITTSNLYWDKFVFNEVRTMYFKDEELEKCTAKKGDLLICNGGDVGRAAIWNYDYDICIQNHISRLRRIDDSIVIRYFFFLIWFYKNKGFMSGKGIGISSLTVNDIMNLLIPLPPLPEQKRIVSAIEKAFEQIDIIEKNKLNLKTYIKQTKSKVLDLAIRGKLVEQNPQEGNAFDLLQKIRAEKMSHRLDFANAKSRKNKQQTETALAVSNPCDNKNVSDVPFEIPENWCWCRLGEIGHTNIGLTYHPQDIKSNGIPVLRSSNIKDDKLDLLDLVRVETNILDNQFVKNGDILICARNGSKRLVGKCILLENLKESFSFGAFMAIFRSEFNNYVLQFLRSNIFRSYLYGSNSTQINQITQEMLKKTLIPLPPLPEQKRIVTKIEQVFEQLDMLEKSLGE